MLKNMMAKSKASLEALRLNALDPKAMAIFASSVIGVGITALAVLILTSRESVKRKIANKQTEKTEIEQTKTSTIDQNGAVVPERDATEAVSHSQVSEESDKESLLSFQTNDPEVAITSTATATKSGENNKIVRLAGANIQPDLQASKQPTEKTPIRSIGGSQKNGSIKNPNNDEHYIRSALKNDQSGTLKRSIVRVPVESISSQLRNIWYKKVEQPNSVAKNINDIHNEAKQIRGLIEEMEKRNQKWEAKSFVGKLVASTSRPNCILPLDYKLRLNEAVVLLEDGPANKLKNYLELKISGQAFADYISIRGTKKKEDSLWKIYLKNVYFVASLADIDSFLIESQSYDHTHIGNKVQQFIFYYFTVARCILHLNTKAQQNLWVANNANNPLWTILKNLASRKGELNKLIIKIYCKNIVQNMDKDENLAELFWLLETSQSSLLTADQTCIENTCAKLTTACNSSLNYLKQVENSLDEVKISKMKKSPAEITETRRLLNESMSKITNIKELIEIAAKSKPLSEPLALTDSRQPSQNAKDPSKQQPNAINQVAQGASKESKSENSKAGKTNEYDPPSPPRTPKLGHKTANASTNIASNHHENDNRNSIIASTELAYRPSTQLNGPRIINALGPQAIKV